MTRTQKKDQDDLDPQEGLGLGSRLPGGEEVLIEGNQNSTTKSRGILMYWPSFSPEIQILQPHSQDFSDPVEGLRSGHPGPGRRVRAKGSDPLLWKLGGGRSISVQALPLLPLGFCWKVCFLPLSGWISIHSPFMIWIFLYSPLLSHLNKIQIKYIYVYIFFYFVNFCVCEKKQIRVQNNKQAFSRIKCSVLQRRRFACVQVFLGPKRHAVEFRVFFFFFAS